MARERGGREQARSTERRGSARRVPVETPASVPGNAPEGGEGRPSRSARHAKPVRRARPSRRSARPGAEGNPGRRRAGGSLRTARKRKGRGRLFLGIVVVLALLALAGAAVGRYLLYHPETEIAAGQPVHVVVEQGATTADIASMLADLGVIDNALMFRYRARESGLDGSLKPGDYDLATGMPYDLVLERLAEGPVIATIDVPIPEGFTARQIAERFAARAGLPPDELMALMTQGASQFVAEHPYLARAHNGSLEGFLFPATYTIEASATPTEVVEKMLDEFDRRIATVDLTYASSRNLDTFDVVTIASILEREAKLPAEFPLVSSVIYNRMAKPMRLQLCASVLYTLPEGTTSLTNDDLDEDSPYNTYIRDGLPVGPISNPGMAALTAAAAPAQTNYLYYVLTGEDGSQTFTATYDEFLKAKQSSAAVRNN